jgi:hypothetical protein
MYTWLIILAKANVNNTGIFKIVCNIFFGVGSGGFGLSLKVLLQK